MKLPLSAQLLGVAMLCSIPARCVGAPAATPIPPPVPPRHERLKPLHRETQLTLAGKPNASIVVLDHQCRPVWSKRMPHAPLLVRGVPTPNGTAKLAVACANGNVDVLSRTGDALQTTRLSGRPTCMYLQPGASGVRMIIGTAKGQLKVCAISNGDQ